MTFTDAGVTIVWLASIEGNLSSNYSLINISSGSGIFEMQSGSISIINSGAGNAITNNSNVEVRISGGVVSAINGTAIVNASTGLLKIFGSAIVTSGAIAINNTSSATVRVSGGAVSTTNASKICQNTINNSSGGIIEVSGGTVSSTCGNAIHNVSTGTVNVSGGTISAINGSAIRNGSSGTIINVSDSARITSANTSYSSGTIVNYGSVLTNSTININGGTVENTSSGSAIYTFFGTVNVNSGVVQASNGSAIYTNAGTFVGSAVNISGGIVQATNGYAIYNSFSSNVNISNGIVSTSGTGKSAIYASITGTKINIIGGTIMTTQSNEYAVYCGSSNVDITLGGNPVITGKIYVYDQRLSVLTSGADSFTPGSAIYTLDFPTYATSMIAVMGGRDFLGNFILHNHAWTLRQSGAHLAIDLASFIPVTNITNVPNTATAGTWNTLTATIEPSNATYQNIIWSVTDAGSTNASISGNDFFAPNKGTAFIMATIANGKAIGEDYIQNFSILLNDDVGIKEWTDIKQWEIYPNPTDGQLTIENRELKKIETVELFDITSKKLLTVNCQSSIIEIDISYLANGIYLVKVKTESGEVIKKIMKN